MIESLSSQIINEVKNHICKEKVIVCIGTDRSTGDSLGPLVGSFLNEMKLSNYKIYGTLDEPVHAVNLEETLDFINIKHPDAFIIAVDASLGRLKSVGKLEFKNKPIKPGAGVGRVLPEVGQCSITGIVNVSGFMEFFVLQNTRLSLVINMAKQISKDIKLSDDYLSNESFKEVSATKQ